MTVLQIATVTAPSSAVIAAVIGGLFSILNALLGILLTRYLRDLDETVRSRRHPPPRGPADPQQRAGDPGPGDRPPAGPDRPPPPGPS